MHFSMPSNLESRVISFASTWVDIMHRSTDLLTFSSRFGFLKVNQYAMKDNECMCYKLRLGAGRTSFSKMSVYRLSSL